MTKLADTDSDPVNDSGTGRDGTRVDETWYNAFVTAIDALIHSTNNPTITPADTIDEVVDARGSIGTLDGRIDVEHNEDGTHKNTGIIATFITEAQLMGGLGGVNLIRNDDFLSWPDGDSAAPVYWALTGAGASVARTGTGLGDTNRKIEGHTGGDELLPGEHSPRRDSVHSCGLSQDKVHSHRGLGQMFHAEHRPGCGL
jgi:hypothetical protein